MRFDQKVAIITGGASGVGLATVELLAGKGASVIIADSSPQGEQVAAAMTEQGLQVKFVQVDVRSEDQVANMVKRAVDCWGRLDIMVANAGIVGRGTAEQVSLAYWEQVIEVNLTGVFLCGKHAVPAMRASGGGSIVNTASIMGLVAGEGLIPYSASKAGVVNLTRAMALDHAKENIRVNAVCPGYISTPMLLDSLQDQQKSDHLVSLHPLGRLGKPEEVARAIAFLASEEASFITGASLTVDGGYTAK